MLFRAAGSLLILCLDDLTIIDNGVNPLVIKCLKGIKKKGVTKGWWLERGDTWQEEICQQGLVIDYAEGHGRQTLFYCFYHLLNKIYVFH